MKKITTILSLIVVSTVFIVGCSSTKKSDGLYLSNSSDDITELGHGMGHKYYINNLEYGNYEVEFTAKEYEYGVLKEEYILHKSTIEHSENDSTLQVGVVEDDSILEVIIDDVGYETDTLDCLKNGYDEDKGVALSILTEDKYFDLNSEVAIAVYSVYSVGEENNITKDLDIAEIAEEFELDENNPNNVVIYMKLSKNN